MSFFKKLEILFLFLQKAWNTLWVSSESLKESLIFSFKKPNFGSKFRLRPYHLENARSRLILEAKQGRAWLVLGWETAWEYQVL